MNDNNTGYHLGRVTFPSMRKIEHLLLPVSLVNMKKEYVETGNINASKVERYVESKQSKSWKHSTGEEIINDIETFVEGLRKPFNYCSSCIGLEGCFKNSKEAFDSEDLDHVSIGVFGMNIGCSLWEGKTK